MSDRHHSEREDDSYPTNDSHTGLISRRSILSGIGTISAMGMLGQTVSARATKGTPTDKGSVQNTSAEQLPNGLAEQIQKILADGSQEFDLFGGAVALSEDGNTALIGADEDDENGENAGAVYVFTRQNDQWDQTQKLFADDGEPSDNFGDSVAINQLGDTALIGATDNEDSGAAYVFTRQDDQWMQTQKLTAEDRQAFSNFGVSVALSEDTALIGASGFSTGGEDQFTNVGTAYVFTRQNDQWTQTQQLFADDGREDDEDDFFGVRVALEDNLALIGAPGDDDFGVNSGAAYMFTRQNNQWIQTQQLLPDSGQIGDSFGARVALEEDTALISALGDDENGFNSGTIYISFFKIVNGNSVRS